MTRDRLLGYVLAILGVAGSAALTQLASQWPNWVLYSCAATAGVSLIIGLCVLFWPAGRADAGILGEPTMNNERKSLFDQSTNVGDNNSGTVAPVYNNVINQAPAPKLVWGTENIQPLPDGRLRTTYDFEVVTPYPIKGVWFEAYGKNVDDLKVIPEATGLLSLGWSGRRDTHAFTTLNQAQGRYSLEITADSRVTVKYGFER